MIPATVLTALFGAPVAVEELYAEAMPGTGAATASVVRLRGLTAGGPFSVVAKRLRPAASGWHAAGASDAAHWAYWRREALAYASGLLPTGPGLRAPRCLAVVGDVVYLEDVPPHPEDLATASQRLTAWQARTPIPDVPWLAAGQLAQRIAVTDLDWSAVDLDPALERIWARRHDLLAGLAAAPKAVSHGDFHLGQLSAAGESTIVVDWATFGIAAAGADHAHPVPPGVRGDSLRSGGHQRPADAAAPAVMAYVQVVDQAAPHLVGVEHHMDEARDAPLVVGDHRPGAVGVGEPAGPHGPPVRLDITVQKRVGVRAPVIAAPAVGVQPRHTAGVVRAGVAQHRHTAARR